MTTILTTTPRDVLNLLLNTPLWAYGAAAVGVVVVALALFWLADSDWWWR